MKCSIEPIYFVELNQESLSKFFDNIDKNNRNMDNKKVYKSDSNVNILCGEIKLNCSYIKLYIIKNNIYIIGDDVVVKMKDINYKNILIKENILYFNTDIYLQCNESNSVQVLEIDEKTPVPVDMFGKTVNINEKKQRYWDSIIANFKDIRKKRIDREKVNKNLKDIYTYIRYESMEVFTKGYIDLEEADYYVCPEESMINNSRKDMIESDFNLSDEYYDEDDIPF